MNQPCSEMWAGIAGGVLVSITVLLLLVECGVYVAESKLLYLLRLKGVIPKVNGKNYVILACVFMYVHSMFICIRLTQSYIHYPKISTAC